MYEGFLENEQLNLYIVGVSHFLFILPLDLNTNDTQAEEQLSIIK